MINLIWKKKNIFTKIYSNLNSWQKVQIARHPDRPHTTDYINNIFSTFVPLSGDKKFGEDAAIICGIGKIIDQFDLPFFIAMLQNVIVASLSFLLVIVFEEIDFTKIKSEATEILYAGILSGGAAFALQLFGQRNISAAPAAIVMSLEGVFAAIAAWIILNQILNLNNIIGCLIILSGVLLSQLAPIYNKNYK